MHAIILDFTGMVLVKKVHNDPYQLDTYYWTTWEKWAALE